MHHDNNMLRIIINTAFVFLFFLPCSAQIEILKVWQAGETVGEEAVERFGIDNCFAVQEIDDALFARIRGKSYKDDCPVPLAELRYIKVLHKDFEGRTKLGEMICNRAVADELVGIFCRLYLAGYPIERMVLVDEYDADDVRSMEANNSSAFNYRTVAGSAKISKHGLGLAVDINPLYNPYVKVSGGRSVVSPEAGRPYADRDKDFRYKIDSADLCCREFLRLGYEWGGAWRSLKDYQHFEK